jgi:hypothetical protein
MGWVLVVLILLLAAPALAQNSTTPAMLLKTTRDSHIIRAQLQLAAERGRAALAMLEADDGQPFDNAVGAAREAYVLIRHAREGLISKREGRKFQDPLMDLSVDRVTKAWNLARTPVDRSKDGLTRARYLEESVRDLTGALQILDEVVWLIP